MGRYYDFEGYLRYGDPLLVFDTNKKLCMGEPWPAQHVRCVYDAHGQLRRRGELLRCSLCTLWWDIYEMARSGGNSRPHGRGSYCLICNQNYLKWRKIELKKAKDFHLTTRLDVSVPTFRKWYQEGILDVVPPLQVYQEDFEED